MAIGGFIDDFIKGATEGITNTKQMKNGITKLATNMTDAQKAATRNAKVAKGLNLKPSMQKAVTSARQVSGNPNINTVTKIRLGGKNAGNLNRSTGKTVIQKTTNVNVKPTFAQQSGDFFGGGIRETVKNYKTGEIAGNLFDSFGKAHTKLDADGNRVLDLKRAAGTYMTASVGARVLSGGGLYKDRNGNTNLPGIPFL